MSQAVASKVLTKVSRHGPGYVFTPAELLHLGSRGAVDQALSRLTRAGKIKRVARGVYVKPETHPLVGEVPPLPAAVAEALARAEGAIVQVSEAAAANALGLSKHVPGRVVYLTTATPRTRRVGKTVIQFKRAAPRRLTGAGTKAGTVVQALRHLGPEGINERVVERIQQALSAKERRQLRRIIHMTPAWMRPTIEEIASEQTGG